MILDLIDREELLKTLDSYELTKWYHGDLITIISDAPTVEAIPKGAYEQVKWERDMAVQQLNDYGVQLGEKADCVRIVRCLDCKYYDKFDGFGLCMMSNDIDGWQYDDFCSYGERRGD